MAFKDLDDRGTITEDIPDDELCPDSETGLIDKMAFSATVTA